VPSVEWRYRAASHPSVVRPAAAGPTSSRYSNPAFTVRRSSHEIAGPREASDVEGPRAEVAFEETPLPFVYILRCGDGSLYTGAAKDLAARVLKHEAGTASRYTRCRRPVELVWSRRVRTWSRALREEIRIKRLDRRGKEALVSSRSAGA
jgi:putative endonuclease